MKLLEGYGLTKAVFAVIAMPRSEYREGSIGAPFSDTFAKICSPGTIEEVPHGREGEICIAGPTVMIGYLDGPDATRQALRQHADGRVWLHTGDLGRMDANGFFYFTDRLKRMIKSSGFNVFPAQVEAVLYAHPQVLEACVVGVPDPAQVERVKAFVVLKDQRWRDPTPKRSSSRCAGRNSSSGAARARSSFAASCQDPHRQDRLPCAGGQGPRTGRPSPLGLLLDVMFANQIRASFSWDHELFTYGRPQLTFSTQGSPFRSDDACGRTRLPTSLTCPSGASGPGPPRLGRSHLGDLRALCCVELGLRPAPMIEFRSVRPAFRCKMAKPALRSRRGGQVSWTTPPILRLLIRVPGPLRQPLLSRLSVARGSERA